MSVRSICVALVLGVLLLSGRHAAAQGAGPGAAVPPGAGVPVQVPGGPVVAPPAAARPDGAAPAVAPASGSGAGFRNGRGTALLFWLFAFLTVAGSIFVITRRNMIAAVMGMVGTFFALAGLYVMLYAHFLAAIQVLVYAGAIMVLFVFVVMILNRPEEEPWALEGLIGKALAGIAILYLVVRLGGILWGIKDTVHAQVAAPKPMPVAGQPDDFGSVRAVGTVLFHEYLFPFEAISLVLLVSVVGAIAVARPHQKDEPTADPGEGSPT